MEKYFTPSIEDIRHGYELEYTSENQVTIGFKFDYIIDSLTEIGKGIEAGYARVPYLTKEQIEGEGWNDVTSKLEENFAYRHGIPSYRSLFEKDNYFLILDTRKPHIEILAKDVTLIDFLPEFPEKFFIAIPCRCINEFRQILKQLNRK